MSSTIIGSTVPTITIERLRGSWSSLWLRYVEAVDLDVHCIDSLVGHRSQHPDRQRAIQTFNLDERPSPAAWYLCSVSAPYRWGDNGHALILPKPGHRQEHFSGNMAITLVNAAVLDITDRDVDALHKHAGDTRYRTCRNWQAAWILLEKLGLPERRQPQSTAYGQRSRRYTKRPTIKPQASLFDA